MSTRAKRLAATLAGVLTATIAVVLPGSPAGGAVLHHARSAPDWVVSAPLAQRAADAQKVMDYWTPERLKAASSYATPARSAPQTSPAPTTTTTTASASSDTERPTTVQPTRGRAAVKNGLPTTVGKVFFRIGDKLYWCSGTAVHSPNRNLVATAAHCAYNVQEPKPVEDWIFIPGYTADGRTDWGIYVGHTLNLHDSFAGLVDWDYDYAFVTVHRGFTWQAEKDAKGQPKKDAKGNPIYRRMDVGRLEDNVGGQGFLWNQSLKVVTHAFGYPAGEQPNGTRPFDGNSMRWCVSRSRMRVTAPNLLLNRGVSIPCMFTAGASGGPWLIRYNSTTGNGYLNGVNSRTWDRDADRRYDHISSPSFTKATYVIYKHATTQSTG
ncbi:serine protease [Thermopolyspora sp. NPDC052614]|uniref:trypsin-like serine peptidase n=1 Tax=Thermopolyspora sp. NPDC052614 TaxID=3155682 RepID=UPI003420ED00